MKEVRNINNEPRQEYEPVQVKLTKVTPQGILCQSGGGEDSREVEGGLTDYYRF